MEKNEAILIPITSQVFIGDIKTAKNYEALTQAGITHVIIVAALVKKFFEPNFRYLRIDAQDWWSYPLCDHFDTSNAFIENSIINGGKVFVH